MTNNGNSGPIYPATPTFGGFDVIFLIFLVSNVPEVFGIIHGLQSALSRIFGVPSSEGPTRLLGYFRFQTTLILVHVRTQVD